MDPEGKGPRGSYSMQDFLLSSEEQQLKFLLLSDPSLESKTAHKKELWTVQLISFLKAVTSFSRAAVRLTLESKTLDADVKSDREEQEPEAEQQEGEREEEEEEEAGIIPPEEIDMKDPEGKGPRGSYSMQDFLLSSEEQQLKFLLLSDPSLESKTAHKRELWTVQLMRFLKAVTSFSRAAVRLTLAEQQEGEREEEEEEEAGVIPPEEIDMRALELLIRLLEEWEIKRMRHFSEKNTDKDAPDISSGVLKAEEARLNDDGPPPAVERQKEKQEAKTNLPKKTSRFLSDTETPGKDAQRQRSPASVPTRIQAAEPGKLTEEYKKPIPYPNFGCLYSEIFREDPKPYSKLLLSRNKSAHPLSLKSPPSIFTSPNGNILRTPKSVSPYKPTLSNHIISGKPYNSDFFPHKPASRSDSTVRTHNSALPYKPASSNYLISRPPSISGFIPYKSTSPNMRMPSHSGSPLHKPTSSTDSDIIAKTSTSNSGFPPPPTSSNDISVKPPNSGFPPHRPSSPTDIIAKTPSTSNSGFPPAKLTSTSDITAKTPPSNSGFLSDKPTSSTDIIAKGPSTSISGFLPDKPTSSTDITAKAPSTSISGFLSAKPTSSTDITAKAPSTSNSGFLSAKPTSSTDITAKAPSTSISGFLPDKPTSSHDITAKTPSTSISGFPYKPTSTSDIIAQTPTSNSGFLPDKPTSSTDIIAKTSSTSNSGFPPHKPTSSTDIAKSPSGCPHKPTSSTGVIAKTPTSNSGFPPHKPTSPINIIEGIFSNSGFPPSSPTYSNNDLSGEPSYSAFPRHTSTSSFFNSLDKLVNTFDRIPSLQPISLLNTDTSPIDSFSREPSSPIYGGSTTFRSTAPCEPVSRSTPKSLCDIPVPPDTNDQYIFIPEHTRGASSVSSYHRKDGTFVRGYERGPCVVREHWRRKN
ncbi:mucin-2-like [Macrobrachium nipponense]|uniref:mucin-2-like n=1 Tax=Macrobrachium nipponense TaxID=159736 RepID=UPI0030C7A6DC